MNILMPGYIRLNIFAVVAISVIAGTFAACSDSHSDRDPVARAETFLDEGRYNAAQSLCDSLIIGDSYCNLSVDDLCRLSLVFVRLSEQANEEANYAFAAKSMQAAVRRDADSVEVFIENLPVDERSQTLVLRQLSNQLDNAAQQDIHDDYVDSVETVEDVASTIESAGEI